MSHPKWTAEHGNLLKSLRQKAGLDIATLARKHILSTTQIGQLENGGSTAFYNDNIKFSTGKKLLHVLGHDLAEIESTNTPPPFTSSPAMPASQSLPRNSFSITPQNFAWPLLFLLIALGVLGFYIEKPADTAVEKTKTENTLPPELPTTVVPKLEEPPKVSLNPTSTIQTPSCNWRATEIEIQPTSPRKSADYVHMVALQNVVVCIKDAEQRVATLELQVGDERSIYGPAPFSVYSATLLQLKVYFQGQLMKLPSSDVQHLKLTAASR